MTVETWCGNVYVAMAVLATLAADAATASSVRVAKHMMR